MAGLFASLERVDDRQEREPVEVPVVRADLADAVFSEHRRDVDIVGEVSLYIRHLGECLGKYGGVPPRRSQYFEPGRLQKATDEAPGFAGSQRRGERTGMSTRP